MTVAKWVAFCCAVAICVARPAAAQEADADKYVWQTNRTTAVAPVATQMIEELRREVDKILVAGPLAAQRTAYADLLQDPYFLYWQPGRVVTTLAMAYPHLTPEQQTRTKEYVRAELNDPDRAPWCEKGFLPPSRGGRREIHTFAEPMGWDRYWGMWGKSKPVMGVFYGLWLYADRTGDWEAMKQHYPQITGMYQARRGQFDVYGTMGAPIAMARIARHFEDARVADAAAEDARVALAAGRKFEGVEASTMKYWKERYEPRQRGRNYQGWMFLEICPEVARFLADNIRDDVLKRHEPGLKSFPLFWLREAPYSTRWTGDEGVGIPPEMMGMVVPVERWVAGVSAEKLAGYTRSAPIGVGDCYWLETLVNAIEVTGKTEWRDVRND